MFFENYGYLCRMAHIYNLRPWESRGRRIDCLEFAASLGYRVEILSPREEEEAKNHQSYLEAKTVTSQCRQ